MRWFPCETSPETTDSCIYNQTQATWQVVLRIAHQSLTIKTTVFLEMSVTILLVCLVPQSGKCQASCFQLPTEGEAENKEATQPVGSVATCYDRKLALRQVATATEASNLLLCHQQAMQLHFKLDQKSVVSKKYYST